MSAEKKTLSKPAAGVPYYTPAQEPPAGTPLQQQDAIPTLFKPLKIRGVELSNRFGVSPMCTYSADDGHLTDFHLVHLGQFALHGTALTIVEATSVTPNGRISPEDSGLWQDSQIAPLRRIVDYVHSQGQKIAIQLAHAGRKASTKAPWHDSFTPSGEYKPREGLQVVGPEYGGWPDDVWAPSAIPFSEDFPNPKEMTVEEIEGLVTSFVDAAKRAIEAGVDIIEIHGAHGYLITEFLSPLSNKRTDKYGGSFENRTRVLIDIIKAVRAVIPEEMPLFVRISATEWMEYAGEPSWDLEQSTQLAKLLPNLGVDLLDVSSGGNSVAQKIELTPYYQIDLAAKIREAVGDRLLIGAVGNINTADIARDVVDEQGAEKVAEAKQTHDTIEVVSESHGGKTKADLVLIARQFLREPEFVLRTAHNLGVNVQWPHQYHRAVWRKGARI
uniref:NADH-dependent flavin oxidoreductase-like protein n=1 Tax=Pyricularia grisea TaxID=148305 RepID=Q5EN19_PYRGI|nr:NADH-dependent flavin oxidoreductase-like protein [Pyricularia grisea]